MVYTNDFNGTKTVQERKMKRLQSFYALCVYISVFCVHGACCNEMCYQFQVKCGLVSYKNVPNQGTNLSDSSGRLDNKCFSTCMATWNCSAVNICHGREPFCEILLENESNSSVCENVDNFKQGCTYYSMVKNQEKEHNQVPKLEIPDDAKSPFTKILQTDADGTVISGLKSELKTKAYDGGKFILVLKDFGDNEQLLLNVDGIKSIGVEVCMETVWNIVSINDEYISRTILMVCSNGKIHRQDWKFGQNSRVKDETFTSAVDWFIRYNVTGNDIYSTGSSGYPYDILIGVESGKELTINIGTYENSVVTANNMVILNSVMFSFNVWDISVTSYSGIVKYQSFAYWFSKLIGTNRFLHVGRWDLESSNIKYFSTKNNVSPKYFVDKHWKRVMKTDVVGKTVNGSFEHLSYFVKNGHRLRVFVNQQALEGLSTNITGTEIIVTTFGSLKMSGGQLDTSLTHIIGNISTTGIAIIYEIPIGSDDIATTRSGLFEMEWFVDVRQWNLIYTTQQFLEDSNSYLPVFQNLFESGAKLRLKWQKPIEEMFIIDTLHTADPDCHGFSVRNVKIIKTKVYYNIYSFSPNGTVKIRSVSFGSGVNSEQQFNNQSLVWFCNY